MNRLLIVSEKPEFRNEVRRVFARTDRCFIEARDGLAALQNAFEDEPTFIVLDADLAGLSAVVVRDRLAQYKETAEIAVSILSRQDLSARAIQAELARTNSPPAMLSASG